MVSACYFLKFNIKVGSTEGPAYTDAVTTCNKLANFVISNNLDV